MKIRIRLSTLVLLFIATVSQAVAQQLKNQGIEKEMPLKTVVLKYSGNEDINDYFAQNKIVRFQVYKAGSVRDVTQVLKSFRTRDGVEKISEGDLRGDYKEFVLTLKVPKNKSWFKKAFGEAGFGHVSVNEKAPIPLSEF